MRKVFIFLSLIVSPALSLQSNSSLTGLSHAPSVFKDCLSSHKQRVDTSTSLMTKCNTTAQTTRRILSTRNLMKAKGYEALLITSPSLLLYMTGMHLNGTLLLTDKKALLFLDPLYKNQIGILSKLFDTVLISFTTTLGAALTSAVPHLKGTFATWASETSEATMLSVQSYFETKNRQLISEEELFQTIRRKKEHEELQQIKKACEITQDVMQQALSLCKKGISEKELSQKIEILFLKRGATSSFEPIVAFGKNSAIPHWVSTDERLNDQELVLIDCGAVWNNYRADMTRVIFLKPPSKTLLNAFQAVKKAYNAIQKKAKKGARCSLLANLANTIFKKAGLQRYVLHGAGHGLGLALHEAPFLEPWSQEKLFEHDVIAIEPAVYIPHVGGIRVENTLVVQEGKSVSFMDMPFYIRTTPKK